MSCVPKMWCYGWFFCLVQPKVSKMSFVLVSKFLFVCASVFSIYSERGQSDRKWTCINQVIKIMIVVFLATVVVGYTELFSVDSGPVNETKNISHVLWCF